MKIAKVASTNLSIDTATMLKLHRPVLLTLVVSVTWGCTLAGRLRIDERNVINQNESDTQSNDVLFSRHIGLRSSSLRASKSGKAEFSSKSSKSSYSSKSSKSTKAHFYVASMGKSAKASYVGADSFQGSNDFGAPSLSINGNSNDAVS